MLTHEQEERSSNQFSHQVNLVAKRCKLCTAEMSLRVSLLSKKYLLVTQPLHKREKVQVKPNPDCYQPRLGSFWKYEERRTYAVLELCVFSIGQRRLCEVLFETVGLMASSSNRCGTVLSAIRNRVLYAYVGNLVPLQEVRLVTS